jgi:hypothetical protein
MIIDATYEQGAIKLPAGLTFRHDYFKVKIEVPEQELLNAIEQTLPIANEPEQKQQTTDLQQRIDAILAPYQAQLAKGQSYTPQEYKAMWRQHLEEKHLDH